MEKKKRLISGVKPTGTIHLGNYFGAIKQFVDLQDEYESSIFIADLHALTTINDKDELKSNTLNVAIDYLSVGLDPEKVTIFKQSDVPEVTEAAWIFNCVTTMPYLMRSHSFKDAEAKNKDINVGVFDYPILMAADILLSNADVVPVGKDQKQHIEIARDTAEKFNRVFGETFKIPEPIILDNVATVLGTNGQKMSKNYKNIIPLFATDEEIKNSVMSIKTDSKSPEDPKDPNETLIYQIHQLVIDGNSKKELAEKYKNGIGYKEAKELLITDLTRFITPLREKREYWQNRPEEVKEILQNGAEKAKKEASEKMKEVRDRIGTNL